MSKPYPLLFLLALIASACGNSANTEGDTDDGDVEASYEVVERLDTPFVGLEKIAAPDSLMISYERRHLSYDQPTLILCHQAGWSRGEYASTADTLYRLGLNCILLDQRSGKEVNGVENLTAERAASKKLDQSYEAAEQDMVAMVEWVNEVYDGEVILVGSSYSAGLALKIAADHPDWVDQVVAFSPGEYYEGLNLAQSIDKLEVPCFLTSSKKESEEVQKLFEVIDSKKKVQFIPEGDGDHGSRVLWATIDNNAEYWAAFKRFIGR